MKPSRIEALSDGIFAIVMTLLVLDLKVPALESMELLSHSDLLWQHLSALWPKFIAFIMSFIVIAIYWSSHHIQFTKITTSDINHMWLNTVFLLFVSLIPFSSALLGEYPFQQAAQSIYGLNLILCGTMMFASWAYAVREERLVESGSVSAELRLNARNKILLPPTLYLIGILLSLINTKISLIFFVLGPIIYFIPVTTHVWEFITDPFGKYQNIRT